MVNYIHTSSLTIPSYWRGKWWFSVWPIHPGIQGQRTNLNIFIAEFSDFNRKLPYMEKLYLLQYFSSIIWRYFKEKKKTQRIHFSQDERYHQTTWQQQKICFLHRRKHYWNLLLSKMIGSPTTLTTSGQCYNHFGLSSSINNYKAYLQTVITDLHMRQKSIWKCCGRIVHKDDDCINLGTKYPPPSLRINMNQCNTLHGEEQNETPREWNSQPTADQFKSRTSPPNTSPVVSNMMEILNHHAIDDDDVEVQPSDYPV